MMWSLLKPMLSLHFPLFPSPPSALLNLDDTQQEYYNLARQFALKELAPHAAKWDAEEIFPVDTLKAAAELGFASIFVKEDVGGSQLSRLDASIIFEALAGG